MLRLLLVLTIACSSSSAEFDASVDAGDAADSAFDTAPDRDPLPLSVVTWNLERFPKDTGTMDAARAIIVEEGFDLIGFQEIIEVSEFIELANSLPDYEFLLNFDRDSFLQHAVLYRRDRLEVETPRRIFPRENGPFPRDPLVVDVRVLDDDGVVRFDFLFVVVHLKASPDEPSRLRRQAGNIALDEWVREQLPMEPDIVIAGDFNDELTDSPPVNVFRPFLIDDELYRFLTLEAAFADEYSFIPGRILLDHILLTRDALEEYGEGTTEILAIDETMPSYLPVVSDHRPVVARFLIP
ncbi:MAG: endonuclease/exonuclease/phosphatase family protein [Myxococcota bacterium]